MRCGEARSAVVEGGRVLSGAGLVAGSSGNLSARQGDLVAITPSSVSIGSLAPEDLAVVDLAGTWVEGSRQPSSELPLHLAVYRATPAAAVAHTHAVCSAAVASTLRRLPAIHYNCVQLGGPVRVAEYATFGSEELARNVVAALQGRTAALLANHGSVAYGSSMPSACERLALLEWLCEHYAHAVRIGTPQELTDSQLADAAEVFRSGRYGGGAQGSP